jgi:hypothetical protein
VVTALQVPSRKELKERLVALLTSAMTREQVADWASTWIRMQDPPVSDPVVWSALRHLAGADLRTSPGEYLHHDIDFHAWLDELESAIDDESS